MATGKSEPNNKVEIWKLGKADEFLAGICSSVKSYLEDPSISPDDRNLCEKASPPVAQVATSINYFV